MRSRVGRGLATEAAGTLHAAALSGTIRRPVTQEPVNGDHAKGSGCILSTRGQVPGERLGQGLSGIQLTLPGLHTDCRYRVDHGPGG